MSFLIDGLMSIILVFCIAFKIKTHRKDLLLCLNCRIFINSV